ncbi:heterokaryon incompatibility protein-domain-containing protein [Phaeosphaeriaceae sp. PMI808]|nr:heterokaryon incompatibility protein-domain-containing protein [Phaeosphaeriaceae sp. PMI808]
MRLLYRNDTGEYTLTKDLIGDQVIPPYGILSHTWGADTEEVTFEDLTERHDGVKDKAGYAKIQFCGEQAAQDNLQYFWIDTCCIQKSNSTELSEAINSMFHWYQNAVKCYVYLSDVFELLAPTSSRDKSALVLCLHKITGIAIEALQGHPLPQFTVDERLSWAKSRKTSREEDKVYSLLGIFGIHMPLIYGERYENALNRLRREIKQAQRSQG